MISEVSNSVPGGAVSRPNGGAGSVDQVQRKPSVEGPTAAQAADAGRDPGSSAAVDGQDLKGMVADLNEFAQTVVQRQLQFSVDEESGKTVIKVIDTETEEIIRQIPPEIILEIQKRLGETNGLLFQSSA